MRTVLPGGLLEDDRFEIGVHDLAILNFLPRTVGRLHLLELLVGLFILFSGDLSTMANVRSKADARPC